MKQNRFDYRVAGVPVESLSVVWNAAATILQKALDRGYGELTLNDVQQLIVNNKFQLWVVFQKVGVVDAAAITEIVDYPAMRACRIVLLAGDDMKDWAWVLNDELEAWAASLGCKRIEAYARPGFKKALKAIGVKHMYDVVGKDIEAKVLH